MQQEIEQRLDVNVLREVIDHLCNIATEERRKSKPYAEMFEASEQGIRGVLSDAEHKMSLVVLDTMQVLEDKFSIKPKSNHLYNLLCCLPYIKHEIQELFSDTETYVCCADKARELIKLYGLDVIQWRLYSVKKPCPNQKIVLQTKEGDVLARTIDENTYIVDGYSGSNSFKDSDCWRYD